MRTLNRRVGALLLGATCLHALNASCRANDHLDASDGSASQQDIADWIEALDHHLFAQRQQATEQLRNAGLAAVEQLQATLQQGSPEATDRSVGVLEEFAASEDRPLQQASLEALVGVSEYPRTRRWADHRLTELCEAICTERFEALGAKCEISRYCPPSASRQTRLVLTVNPDTWQGDRSSFEALRKLRRLELLRVDAPMVDDRVAMELASLPRLQMLELINTQTTLQLVEKLQQEYPDLRVRVRSHSYLGVQFWPGGALEVMSVEHDSPADRAGLAEGDEIVAFNDAPVVSFDALTAHIAQHRPGETVEVSVRRGSKLLELQATLTSKNWSSGD